MCTAISSGSFVGRNLDIDKNYGGEVIITPRNYEIFFKNESSIKSHYAMIGIGAKIKEYPLYFDAANEKGLYIASLNYVENAKYLSPMPNKVNLAPYELIPYFLAKCATVAEARVELDKINLIDIPFSQDLPPAELHYFIADKYSSSTVEPDATGISVYDNPIGVLTNNPPFPYQLLNLSTYQGLSSTPVENRFSDGLLLQRYSHGMGALGLPGDLSSASRFVRVAFHKSNSKDDDGIKKIIRLLSTVAMPRGSVKTDKGYEYTEYTAAVDLKNSVYAYRTYDSMNHYAVKLSEENIDGNALITHELKKGAVI